MSNQIFMIAFNDSDHLPARRVHAYVSSDDVIRHWWNHIPGLFLVETAISARDLGNRLRAWLANETTEFVVMKADPDDSSGFLDDDAAAWIERRQASLQQQSLTTP